MDDNAGAGFDGDIPEFSNIPKKPGKKGWAPYPNSQAEELSAGFEKIPEKKPAEPEEKRQQISSDTTLKTDIDDLLKLVASRKEIAMADAAKLLGVPLQTVESWSIFLEEDGIIDVRYKLTTPYLVSKEASLQEEMVEKRLLKGDKKQLLVEYPKEDSLPGPDVDAKPGIDASIHGTRLEQKVKKGSSDQVPHLMKEASREMDSLFDKAYELIANGKFDEARSIYSAIKLESDTLPIHMKEAKRELSANLVKLNKDIWINLERQNHKRTREITDKVMSKLAEMNRYSIAGDILKAEETYKAIDSLLTSFPVGFESRKADLKRQVIISYRQLLIHKKELLSRYNQRKSKQISDLIALIEKHIEEGSYESARKKYEEARSIYNELPEGFSEENEHLSKALFSLIPEIMSKLHTHSSQEFDRQATKLKELTIKSYDSLRQGNIEAAEGFFNDIKVIYGNLPRDFFVRRVELESRILQLEHELLAKAKSSSLSKLRDISQRIQAMLKVAKDYLKRGSPELAEGVYYEMLSHYKEIPDGFMEQKSAMNVAILNLYREILLKYDEPFSMDFDEKAESRYHSLLHLLVAIKDDIDGERFDAAESKANELSELFGHLPFRFVQERSRIWKEVSDITSEIELYSKTKQLKEAKAHREELIELLAELKAGYLKLYADKEEAKTYSKMLEFIKNNYIYYYNHLNGTSLKEIPGYSGSYYGEPSAVPKATIGPLPSFDRFRAERLIEESREHQPSFVPSPYDRNKIPLPPKKNENVGPIAKSPYSGSDEPLFIGNPGADRSDADAIAAAGMDNAKRQKDILDKPVKAQGQKNVTYVPEVKPDVRLTHPSSSVASRMQATVAGNESSNPSKDQSSGITSSMLKEGMVKTLIGKAEVRLANQKYDDALDYINQALLIDPQNAKGQNVKSRIIAEMGNDLPYTKADHDIQYGSYDLGKSIAKKPIDHIGEGKPALRNSKIESRESPSIEMLVKLIRDAEQSAYDGRFDNVQSLFLKMMEAASKLPESAIGRDRSIQYSITLCSKLTTAYSLLSKLPMMPEQEIDIALGKAASLRNELYRMLDSKRQEAKPFSTMIDFISDRCDYENARRGLKRETSSFSGPIEQGTLHEKVHIESLSAKLDALEQKLVGQKKPKQATHKSVTRMRTAKIPNGKDSKKVKQSVKVMDKISLNTLDAKKAKIAIKKQTITKKKAKR